MQMFPGADCPWSAEDAASMVKVTDGMGLRVFIDTFSYLFETAKSPDDFGCLQMGQNEGIYED